MFIWGMRKNIAWWCQQIFCFQKFVDNGHQCFAFTRQANFPAHNLNFHWRWRWWNQILKSFLLYYELYYCEHSKHSWNIMLGNSGTTINLATYYSKVSIERPVLLNDLVWIFSKNHYQMTRSILEKNDHTIVISGPPRLIFGLY
jgi:hypothetical protein